MDGLRRIAIVGGGVSGLLCALALRMIANSTKTMPIKVMLLQDDPSFYEAKEHQRSWVLWPWACRILGKYMGTDVIDLIRSPVRSAALVDADDGRILSEFPNQKDPRSKDQHTCGDMSKYGKLYSVRIMDLLRILLISLRVESYTKKVAPDERYTEEIKTLFEKSHSSTTWFEDELYTKHIPEFYVGYKLYTYIITASKGEITLKFENGEFIKVDMLIGADGKDSIVRNLLGSGRYAYSCYC